MEIPKHQVIDFLRTRGDDDRAAQAEAELPDHLDSVEDAGLLATYGVDVDDVAGSAPGAPGPEKDGPRLSAGPD
jgi:hypothetical protein